MRTPENVNFHRHYGRVQCFFSFEKGLLVLSLHLSENIYCMGYWNMSQYPKSSAQVEGIISYSLGYWRYIMTYFNRIKMITLF
jgi:hypothetical protein